MHDTLAQLLPQMVLGVAVQVALSLGLHAWGRSVAKRHVGWPWRWAAWMPLVALGLVIAGAILSTVVLLRAFGSVSSVTPAERQVLLASGISSAMTWTAVLVVPAWLLYLASVLAFAVGWFRQPASSAPADAAE